MPDAGFDKGTALLVVDYTVDFIAEDGKLSVGAPGLMIERALASLVSEALGSDAWVFVCSDVHEETDEFHPESKLFPTHNIRGSKGRELYGRVGEMLYGAQGGARVIFLDKTRYSAFAGTNLDLLLRERGISTVAITGVCTDICVMHTAIGAYNLGYGIRVHESAVASFDAQAHDFALKHMRSSLGADVV